MDIVLGSKSVLKLAAVRVAMQIVRWNGLSFDDSVPSYVPDQPTEYETVQGAINRAQGARKNNPSAIAIGIENGIRYLNDQWEDWAVIAIILPSGEIKIFHSDAVEIPSGIVIEARKRGVTIGSIVAEAFGCPAYDPHIVLTGGKDSREAILTRALVTALNEIKPLIKE